MSASDIPLHGEGGQTSEERDGPPVEILFGDREPQIRQALEQRRERDLRLEPGERRAEAEVRSASEADVPVLRSIQLEHVGVGELR